MTSIRPRSIEIKRNYDEISGNNLDTPKEVGYFSVNSDGTTLHNNRMALRFYRSRNPESEYLDLNRWLVTNRKSIKPEADSEMLTNVLRWIIRADFELSKNVHFVTTRRCLKTLLCTPYCRDDSWTIYASKFNGVVYFVDCTKDDLLRHTRANTRTDRNLQKCKPAERSSKNIEPNNEGNESYEINNSFKFLEYMTADSPEDAQVASAESPIDTKYRIIVENSIDTYKLLFRAGVCAAKRKPQNGDISAYIELKTHERKRDIRYAPLPDLTFLRLWARSIVTGIEDVVCGLVDELGIVRQIETYRVKDIPNFPQNKWLPRNCFGFLHQFLKELKTILDEEGEDLQHRPVYKCRYNGGNKIDVDLDAFDVSVIDGRYVRDVRHREDFVKRFDLR